MGGSSHLPFACFPASHSGWIRAPELPWSGRGLCSLGLHAQLLELGLSESAAGEGRRVDASFLELSVLLGLAVRARVSQARGESVMARGRACARPVLALEQSGVGGVCSAQGSRCLQAPWEAWGSSGWP